VCLVLPLQTDVHFSNLSSIRHTKACYTNVSSPDPTFPPPPAQLRTTTIPFLPPLLFLFIHLPRDDSPPGRPPTKAKSPHEPPPPRPPPPPPPSPPLTPPFPHSPPTPPPNNQAFMSDIPAGAEHPPPVPSLQNSPT